MVSRQLFITAMMIQFYLLTREAMLSSTHVGLVVQTAQLAGTVAILLIVRSSTDGANTLACDQRWQHLLLSIPLHLAHDIIMVLLVEICYFRESNLVSRILILDFI